MAAHARAGGAAVAACRPQLGDVTVAVAPGVKPASTIAAPAIANPTLVDRPTGAAALDGGRGIRISMVESDRAGAETVKERACYVNESINAVLSGSECGLKGLTRAGTEM